MTEFHSGVAVAEYRLNIRQAREAANEMLGIYARLRQEESRIGQTRGGASGAGAAQSQQQAERAILARASAEARLAQVQNTGRNTLQGLTQAERIYADALARVDRSSVAAVRSSTQLAQVRNRIAAQGSASNPALPRTFAGFTGTGLAQLAGVAVGPQLVAQAARAGIDAGRAALELDRTLRVTRELTGTQAQYNQVVAAAREQQARYGGSLQANIAGIQGLVVTARSTGAELNTLINLSQRLAVLDPAQGAEGARIALQEVLSGDPRSLARRYEIPLSALQKIKDESIPVAERLQVLDAYLNRIGITSRVVDAAVSDQARAFNRLGAELGDLQTNVGTGLANAFAGAATGLGRLIGVVNSNPQAIAELRALLSGKGAITEQDIAQVSREQATALAERQLSPGRVGAPFASQATRNDPDLLRGTATAAQENEAAIAALRAQLIALNLVGGETATRVQQLASQWQSGAISADTFRAQIEALSIQQNRGRDIEAGRIQTLNELQQADRAASAQLLESLQTRIEAKNKTDDLTRAESILASIGEQVKQGLLTSGEGAIALGKLLNIAERDADALLTKLLALGKLSGAAAFSNRIPADAQRALGYAKEQAEAIDLQRLRTDLLGTRQQKIAQAERDLAAARRIHGAQSKEAIEAEAKLRDAQEAGRVRGAQGTADRLANIARTSGTDRLRIERENMERLRDQEQDFNIRRTRSQEDFERQRRRLLAQGRIAEARRLTEEFAIDQRRAQEDFTRQRTRTLRDNAERGGDLETRTDNRVAAATRRRGGGIATLADAAPVGGGGGGGDGSLLLRIQIQPTQLTLDGHTLVELTWPEIEQRIAGDLAVIGITVPPGSGQSVGVSGARP